MKGKLKAFFKWIILFVSVYLMGSVLFVSLFHTKLLAGLHVLMYSGIILLIISGIFVIAILALIRRYLDQKLDAKDIAIMFMMFSCVNMVLFTLIPVTVERSVSVFMLSYMSDHQQHSYQEEEIEKVFIQYYVDEDQAFAKRFAEQEVTGTIEKKDNGYKITRKGMAIVKAFRIVAKLFDTDERLLYGKE